MDEPADPQRASRPVALQGIAGEHRMVPTGAQVWLPRVLAGLSVVQIALAAVGGHPWSALFWVVPLMANLIGGVAVHRVRTVLSDEGVRVENGLARGRVVRWHEVTGIRVQGRWDATSRLLRRTGRDVVLHGLAAADAEELASRLRRAGLADASQHTGGPGPDADVHGPASAPAAPVRGGARPDDVDADVEGPFRRGRPRR